MQAFRALFDAIDAAPDETDGVTEGEQGVSRDNVETTEAENEEIVEHAGNDVDHEKDAGAVQVISTASDALMEDAYMLARMARAPQLLPLALVGQATCVLHSNTK